MPISPEQAVSSFNQKLCDFIELEIDHTMAEPDFVKCNQMGGSQPYWVIPIRGWVSDPEKEYLIRRYTQAGWRLVEVVNHAGTGERPDMIAVKLYGNPT